MKTSDIDAITLLTKDHAEVKAMFKEYEGLTKRAVVGRKKLATQICRSLTLHAMLEEEIFYPAVRRAIKEDDLMDESLVEHASVKELIAQVENMEPDDDLYDAKLKVMSEQVEHHVREEEGEMFPKVRKTNLDLISMGQEMSARKEEVASMQMGTI
ncbi:MAG TPA: hemerythrin domain-containing protein [Burkholderiales bacterium]|nr:hemerythrin domain-containing protein [Burkholderiales bacterium]